MEETSQGFAIFQTNDAERSEWICFWRNIGPAVWTEACAFCKREVPTRGHHVVPRCKGGRDIAPTCHSCEDFIHKTWTHNELRDTFNTVEKIQVRSAIPEIPSLALQAAGTARSSGLGATGPEPVSRTAESGRFVRRPFPSP